MTEQVVLPVVNGGIGAAVAVHQLQAKKTLVVTNVAGTVVLEGSADGVDWCPVVTFQGPGNKDTVKTVAAGFMRLNATNGSADSVWVIAERGQVRTAALPAPPVNGPGASVDVSAFGCLTTVFVGDPGAGQVLVEISPNDADWYEDFKSFTAAGCDTKEISALFIRLVGQGGSAAGSVASQDPGDSGMAITSPLSTIVFRPGATGADAPGGNVYTTWPDALAAIDQGRQNGLRHLELDNLFAPPSPTGVAPGGENPCFIPDLGVGGYDLTDVVITDRRSNPAAATCSLEIGSGVSLLGLREIRANNLDVIYNGVAGIPIVLDPTLYGGEPVGFIISGARIFIYNTLAGVQPLIQAKAGGTVFADIHCLSVGGISNGTNPPPDLLSPIVTIDAGQSMQFQLQGQTGFAKNWITGDGGLSLRLIHPSADNDPTVFGDGLSSFGPGSANPGLLGAVSGSASTNRMDPLRFRPSTWSAAVGNTAQWGRQNRVDTTANAVRVDLPEATSPLRLSRMLLFLDIGGNLGVNALTIRAAVGDTINGSAVETGAGESDTVFGAGKNFGTIFATQITAGAGFPRLPQPPSTPGSWVVG